LAFGASLLPLLCRDPYSHAGLKPIGRRGGIGADGEGIEIVIANGACRAPIGEIAEATSSVTLAAVCQIWHVQTWLVQLHA
jgi:hypothetical protein